MNQIKSNDKSDKKDTTFSRQLHTHETLNPFQVRWDGNRRVRGHKQGHIEGHIQRQQNSFFLLFSVTVGKIGAGMQLFSVC